MVAVEIPWNTTFIYKAKNSGIIKDKINMMCLYSLPTKYKFA